MFFDMMEKSAQFVFTKIVPKQFDGEVPVMLELWRIRSIHSLPSLPGPLRPGVVAPERVLSIGRIKLIYLLIQN